MNTKPFLIANLSVMAGLLIFALITPETFLSMVNRPELYVHVKFVHILTVALFFANTVIGTIWETRSLLSKRPEIIRYTYKTVVWFDAVFTAPIIIVALLSGITLGTILGGVWTMGWLGTSFILFMTTGVIWVIFDIPSQYKIKRGFENLAPQASSLPPELTRLLWYRMGVNLAGILPLLFIFFLMVHKPELPKIEAWFKSRQNNFAAQNDAMRH